jgi:hypothetical protein
MLRRSRPGARRTIAAPLLAVLGLLAPVRALGVPTTVVAAEPGTHESAPDAAPVGQPFRSDSGRFEVLMPGTPEVESKSRQTLGGRITSTQYSVERDAFEFWVEHHDLPAIAEVLLSSGSILSRAKDDFLDAIHGRERTFVETSLDGHPARTFSFEIPGERELVGDGLLTLVGSRLYIVAAVHPRRDPRGGLLDRLLKTFTVWAR